MLVGSADRADIRQLSRLVGVGPGAANAMRRSALDDQAAAQPGTWIRGRGREGGKRLNAHLPDSPTDPGAVSNTSPRAQPVHGRLGHSRRYLACQRESPTALLKVLTDPCLAQLMNHHAKAASTAAG